MREPAKTPSRSPLSVLGTLVLLTGAYYAMAKIGLALAHVHPSATAVWPPTGFALATLLLLGRRVWIVVLAGAFLVNLTTAGSLATSLGIALGNTLEALLSARLVERWAGGRNVLCRPQSIVQLAVIAGLGATVSATAGVTSLAVAGFASWAQFRAIWTTWWLGNIGGVLLVTPLALAWSVRPAYRWDRARVLEASALLLVLLLTAQWVFGGWAALPADDALTFLCIPIILWAACRFHQQGAATAVFVVASIAIAGTLNGRGPFVGADANDALLMIQIFSGVMTITSLVLAASVSERQRLENALRQASEDLGVRFQRQQADLAKAIEALRAEIAARGVAERYARLAIETTERPIVVLDQQLRVRMANPAFCRTFQLAEHRVEDQPLLELGTQACDRPELRALLEDVATKGIRHEGTDLELEVPGMARRRFLVDARCVVPDKTKDMDLVIFLAMEDVTQRKEAEEALRTSEARFRAVADTAIDGIVCANQNGEILYANRAVAGIFGYAADELIGRPLTTLIPARFHVRDRGGFARHLDTDDPRAIGKTVELVAVRRSGAEFPVELSLTRWEAGEQVMFAGIMRDISQRKAAEREILRLNAELEERVRLRTQDLERSNRELERFAYLAAHDLQEPLRTVTNYAQLLERRYRWKLDARADEIIDMVVSGSSWMHALIKDLLEYSLLGTSPLQLDEVDCEAVLERALANLQLAIRESRARISHERLPRVVADAPQLVLVFQNLIGNALKFHGPDPPSVHVSARANGPDWEIVVQDNGIGIESKHLEEIFGVFQRLHTREEYPGTGIGLAICRRIVERLGGSIRAESEPGKGTSFFLTLSGAARHATQPVEIGVG